MELLRDQIAAGHDVSLIYSPLRSEPAFTGAVASLGAGLRVRRLPMHRGVGVHDAFAAVQLWRLLRELGPFDVVHGHSSKAGALVRLAGLFSRAPAVIYTPHAFVTLSPEAHPVYGAIEWAASWFCEAIIVGSEQEYAHARNQLRLPAARLRLIPMGVDLNRHSERAAARQAFGLPDESFVVGFVGRLAPQKNPLRLAHVFREVAKARPDARLVIIGDGELRDVLEERLRAFGLLDATVRAGEIDGPDAMAAFDCLVCTSDYESFGLIFPEALAAGVPLVSPPVGVAAQAITAETGVLTSFGAEDIARGVLEIASLDEDARRAVAEACRERARLFDIRETVAQTRALYDEVLARKRRAPA